MRVPPPAVTWDRPVPLAVLQKSPGFLKAGELFHFQSQKFHLGTQLVVFPNQLTWRKHREKVELTSITVLSIFVAGRLF